MVWYLGVNDVICANEVGLRVSGDKHPHKLLGSRERIQRIIDCVQKQEDRGLTYQAASLLKKLAGAQIFDGGNHRAAYLVALTFLFNNDRKLNKGMKEEWPFLKDVEMRTVEEIQAWIEG